MSPLQQLRGTRILPDRDGAWLPISFGAVDASGETCPVLAGNAVRFGVLAGLRRHRGSANDCTGAVQLLCHAVASKSLHAWEEAPGRTRAEVLAALDAAIALAKEGEHR